jgi:hypothetical protein
MPGSGVDTQIECGVHAIAMDQIPNNINQPLLPNAVQVQVAPNANQQNQVANQQNQVANQQNQVANQQNQVDQNGNNAPNPLQMWVINTRSKIQNRKTCRLYCYNLYNY